MDEIKTDKNETSDKTSSIIPTVVLNNALDEELGSTVSSALTSSLYPEFFIAKQHEERNSDQKTSHVSSSSSSMSEIFYESIEMSGLQRENQGESSDSVTEAPEQKGLKDKTMAVIDSIIEGFMRESDEAKDKLLADTPQVQTRTLVLEPVSELMHNPAQGSNQKLRQKQVGRFTFTNVDEHDDFSVFLKDGSPKHPPANLERFKFRSDNANWCDYCIKDIFIHRTSREAFIKKCITLYEKNKTYFPKRKEAHMLGSVLNLDQDAYVYLSTHSPELFERYRQSYRGSTHDSRTYVLGGVISQYNERVYTSQLSHSSHLSNSSHSQHEFNKYNCMDEWLKMSNIVCSHCSFYACPFHQQYGNFGSRAYGENQTKIHTCGWCDDSLTEYYSMIAQSVRVVHDTQHLQESRASYTSYTSHVLHSSHNPYNQHSSQLSQSSRVRVSSKVVDTTKEQSLRIVRRTDSTYDSSEYEQISLDDHDQSQDQIQDHSDVLVLDSADFKTINLDMVPKPKPGSKSDEVSHSSSDNFGEEIHHVVQLTEIVQNVDKTKSSKSKRSFGEVEDDGLVFKFEDEEQSGYASEYDYYAMPDDYGYSTHAW
ncbi:hypothetical protein YASMINEVIRUS_1372 [Yasminevirus sp. GU-2018]|uniref:Uncharacterized protein n=1 Tax=Yasminevirus sp. GU-2018 TaxID=2420051 RepID=A0A5K0UAX6_9VIRU|nr:hypothetical protein YASMINEVIRUS_1372 [Yasminevirus sp. GU-2018]